MITSYEEAKKFFEIFYHGVHHFPNKLKNFGDGWCIQHYGTLSTFDFNKLTWLVYLAHRLCFRVEISQGGPWGFKICIWKRKRKSEKFYERHPDLEEQITDFDISMKGRL